MNIVRLLPVLFLWAIISFTSVEVVCADEPVLEPAGIQSAEERSATYAKGVNPLETSSTKLSLTPEEQAWLAEHNEVKVALFSIAPYQFKSKGVVTGYQVDLLKAMLEKAGLEPEFSLSPLAEVLEAFKEHDADIALNFMKTRQRSRHLLFSENIYEIQMAIFAQAERQDLHSIEALKDQRVASYKGYGFEPTLKRILPDARIIRADDVEGMLRLVGAGEADAAIQEINTGEYILRKNYLHNVVNHGEFLVSGEPRQKASKYVVRNDLPQLFSILDKAYASITPSEKQRIWNKWFSKDEPAIAKQGIHFTPQEQAWLAHNYTVQVRVANHKPYLFLIDGKPVGIAVDFIEEISERTGIKFHFVMNSPSFSIDLKRLMEHTGPDMISTLMPTLERQKHILFAKVYTSSPRFIFTRDDTPFVSSMEMLFGKKVAVVKNYVVHNNLAENYPSINLQPYDNNKDALEAVSAGKAFAFIGDIMSTPHMINEYGLKNLKAVAPSGLPEHTVAMGIRDDWPELRDIINKGFVAIPAADKAAIINKWSSVKFDYGITSKDVWTWVLIVVIAVSVIIWLFVLWTKSLKQQVQKRTTELKASNKSLEFEMAERKQAEERFKQVAEHAQEWVWEVNAEGLYTYSSPVVEKILGYKPEEIVGKKHFYDLFSPEQRTANKRSAFRAFRQMRPFISFENPNVHKSGKTVWLSTSGMPMLDKQGELCGYRGTDTDITERKQAEEKLRKSESKYRTLLENLPQKIFLKDTHSTYISCNKNYARDVGIMPEEIVGKTDYGFFPRELADKYRGDDKRILESGQTERLEEQYVRDGKKTWIAIIKTPVRDKRGTVTGILGIFLDITEQKRVKDALLESEEKFRVLVTNSEEIVYMIAMDGTFLLSEGKGLSKLGLKPGQMVGQSVFEMYKDYPDMLEEMRRTFNGETVTNEVNVDGNYFRNWYTPHKNPEGQIIGLLGLSVNITERKQAEGKLQQYQQRLKSMAVQLTLAEEQERRRIAEDLHDHIGQSLALARMQLATARKGAPPSDKRDAQFDNISQSLLKAIQDTRHLIFELSSPSLDELGLSAAIGEWMDEYVVKLHGIEAEFFDHTQALSLDNDLRTILFRNVRELLTNAIKHARAKTISVWLESRADGLEITIQDDGVGFDPGICLQSGDDCGGFGLFSVRERMSDLGGMLTITSQPGAGCKAVLMLPLHKHNPETQA